MRKRQRTLAEKEFIPTTLGKHIIQEQWKYPPTVSRNTGKSRNSFDTKYFMRMVSTMFSEPVILMSDLHQHSLRAVKKLAKQVDLSEYIVLAVGDMAGQGYFGSDGDPTPTYRFLSEETNLFYFVQGNHDLPAEDESHLDLVNDNGTPCMIQNRQVVSTPIGRLGGINGIKSHKPHPYKLPPREFDSELARMFHENNDIDILLTHDTPKLPIGNAYIGDERLYELVASYKPRIHVYGHCFHPSPVNIIDGVTYINVDARMLVFDPAI